MTQYFEYLSPLRMVHTECYCRHHFGTDPTCTMWYNLMIMYTYFWMITILNRDFFRAYYNIISIRVCSKETTCYTTVESPYCRHHGTTAAVWIIEVSVFQRLPVYFQLVWQCIPVLLSAMKAHSRAPPCCTPARKLDQRLELHVCEPMLL